MKKGKNKVIHGYEIVNQRKKLFCWAKSGFITKHPGDMTCFYCKRSLGIDMDIDDKPKKYSRVDFWLGTQC